MVEGHRLPPRREQNWDHGCPKDPSAGNQNTEAHEAQPLQLWRVHKCVFTGPLLVWDQEAVVLSEQRCCHGQVSKLCPGYDRRQSPGPWLHRK